MIVNGLAFALPVATTAIAVTIARLRRRGGHRAERDLAREAAEYVMYLKHGHFWRYTVLLTRLHVVHKLIEVAGPLVSAGPAATTASPVRPAAPQPAPGEGAAARGVAPVAAPLPPDWEALLAGIDDLAARARAETDAAYQQAIAGLGRWR